MDNATWDLVGSTKVGNTKVVRNNLGERTVVQELDHVIVSDKIPLSTLETQGVSTVFGKAYYPPLLNRNF